MGVDLDHLAQVVFVSFLHCEVALFSPFHSILFGRQSFCVAPPMEQGLYSTAGMIVFSPTYVFSFARIGTDSRILILFILWVTIQHYCISLLRLSQPGPRGALEGGFFALWRGTINIGGFLFGWLVFILSPFLPLVPQAASGSSRTFPAPVLPSAVSRCGAVVPPIRQWH